MAPLAPRFFVYATSAPAAKSRQHYLEDAIRTTSSQLAKKILSLLAPCKMLAALQDAFTRLVCAGKWFCLATPSCGLTVMGAPSLEACAR